MSISGFIYLFKIIVFELLLLFLFFVVVVFWGVVVFYVCFLAAHGVLFWCCRLTELLTWTTGSLTCRVCDLFACVHKGGDLGL